MIVVYGVREQLNPIKTKLSEVIHGCVVAVLGMPEGKRAHRFIPLELENFFYPTDRSEAYTVIEINMMLGRTVETKKALIKALYERISAELFIANADIEITIKEQPAHCWGFRGVTGDEAADLGCQLNV